MRSTNADCLGCRLQHMARQCVVRFQRIVSKGSPESLGTDFGRGENSLDKFTRWLALQKGDQSRVEKEGRRVSSRFRFCIVQIAPRNVERRATKSDLSARRFRER